MGRLGFEPRTSRLKAECSTTELATRFICALGGSSRPARLLNLAYRLNGFGRNIFRCKN